MRRSSNGSSKPFQPLPTRRASFNGGFEADFNMLLQNDNVFLEQQQAQITIKKSPRKLTLNSSILPPSPTQKLLLNIQPSPAPLTTIPTLTTSSSGMGTNTSITSTQEQHANLPSNLYKTELCRSFEETGTCRYGSKCQFAHGYAELRPAPRHPKYKTEICKTFHSVGTCPYGTRCRFIHTSPSDNIDWITADVDNPLFDLHDKNAPEFDRSPNTIPLVPTYQSFMARLPPTPHRYHQQQYQQQTHSGYAFQVNNNEPLLSVIRAEIPPRLEPIPRVESRTLIIERPSTIPVTRPISISVTPPVATSINTTPASTCNTSNISNSSSNITTGSNVSTVNISAATMNLAAALTAAAAAITPPLPISSNVVVPTTSAISTANNAVNSKPPSPPISNTTSNSSMSLPVPTINAPNSTSTLSPGHKHRLPVFRELCHQSSVERLQQEVLDFVFEKEQ